MDQIKAFQQKAELNLKKKQQVCTDSILKDFNYTLSMPLEHSHVQKSGHSILHHDPQFLEERNVIQKDIRAPEFCFTFDIQKDVHANSQDPRLKAQIDKSVQIQFSKVQLQSVFEELEKVQLKLDTLNN